MGSEAVITQGIMEGCKRKECNSSMLCGIGLLIIFTEHNLNTEY